MRRERERREGEEKKKRTDGRERELRLRADFLPHREAVWFIYTLLLLLLVLLRLRLQSTMQYSITAEYTPHTSACQEQRERIEDMESVGALDEFM